MDEKKLYYWIKLKTNFFDSDTIDFLMSQKNGADYVVLYQMLCLKTANTDGGLYSQLGELIVPFDVEKIVRITKYFSLDTVRVALELYKNLGLVYVQENEILRISNFDNLIGYETQWAQKKRLYRDRKKSEDKVEDNVRQEYRDKRLEIRDKSIDIESENNTTKENTYVSSLHSDTICAKEKQANRRFVKPTVEEVRAYISEKNYPIDAEQFWNFYEAKGWMIGKAPMKNWRACVATWLKNGRSNSSVEPFVSKLNNPKMDVYDTETTWDDLITK